MRHDGRTSVQYVEERRITISYHTQLNDQYIGYFYNAVQFNVSKNGVKWLCRLCDIQLMVALDRLEK